MLKRLLGLFRGHPIDVPDTRALAEGQSRNVTLGDLAAGGQRLVLCRVNGALHAVDSLCPHQGGRITPGALVDGKFARCPLHGYVFDPKDGREMHGRCKKVATYKVVEQAGNATIWL